MFGSAAAAAVPQPSGSPIWQLGPTHGHLLTAAASLRLAHHCLRRHRHHLVLLLQSSLEGFTNKWSPKESERTLRVANNAEVEVKFSHLGHVPGPMDNWLEIALQFKGFNFLQLSNAGFSSFNGGEIGKDLGNKGTSHLEASRRNSFKGRQLTNILLAMNILIYIAQIATQGKLLLWGAKVNSLIDKGELWRLATSSFLHANIGHLVVNCYSLNSVGPSVENISGPRRFLAVYFSSAITSSAMSYWFCQKPAVGASGAIFGLVGSFAVFVLRHRSLVGSGKEDLQHIARVIALNLVVGLLSKGIDNWGHVGGLLGGVATSWLLGPAWKYESLPNGRRIFFDRAPIFSLIQAKREPRQFK